EMRCCSRHRHAFARELSQRRERQVSTPHTYRACRPKTDAAHAHCRSSPGTTEREIGRDFIRKVVPRHCRSFGKTRTIDLVSESARFLYLPLVQQLRRSAQLSELQCRAHVSPASRSRRTIELSFVRPYRGRTKEMPGMRTRRADLLRIRHRESRSNGLPNFPKSGRAPNGRRLDDAQGSVSRNVEKFSYR